MTSVQTIFARVRADLRQRAAGAPSARLAMVLLVAGVLCGCGALTPRSPELTPPLAIFAPYDTSRGEILWAVLPLTNETGTDLFDPLIVTDKLVAAAEQIHGIRTVPLNRTLVAMHALHITRVTNPGQIREIASAMGVDGVLVGSITAYDPYTPPTFGMSLALYANSGAMDNRASSMAIDTRKLSASPTEQLPGAQSGYTNRPASVVSDLLDAKNHGVLEDLKKYAQGRHDPQSALSWHRYTASMDLYTQFATHHMVAQLIENERARIWELQQGAEDSSSSH